MFDSYFSPADQAGIHLGIRAPNIHPNTVKAKAYLFNPGKVPIILSGRIRVSEVLPDDGR
jgi:hypothetical protein